MNQLLPLGHDDLADFQGLDWIFTGLASFGQAFTPVLMVVVGASISKGPDFSELRASAAVALAATKMLVHPAVVAVAAWCLSLIMRREQPNAMWLVMVVSACLPTASHVLVQIESDQARRAMSTLLFVEYVMAPFTLTISLFAAVLATSSCQWPQSL